MLAKFHKLPAALRHKHCAHAQYRTAFLKMAPPPQGTLSMPALYTPLLLIRRVAPRLALAATALLAGSALAAGLDVNTATQAQLEQLRGIGVATSERLLAERARLPFADWADLIARVPGMGRRGAQRLSEQGLRVGEQPYTPPR